MSETVPDTQMMFTTEGATRCLSVHDFVRIDLPFDAVVGAFANFVTTDLLRGLIVEAWNEESAEVGNALARTPESETTDHVAVRLGEQRGRQDAVILPITWTASVGRWVPPLHADLEIAQFGPNRTHLHVLGLSQLRPDTVPLSDRASLEHRLAVAVVRHVLFSLANMITQSSGWSLGSR